MAALRRLVCRPRFQNAGDTTYNKARKSKDGMTISRMLRSCFSHTLAGGTTVGRMIWAVMSELGNTLAFCCCPASPPTFGFAFLGVPMTGNHLYLGKYTSTKVAPFFGRTW